jgi:hypothetical protein
VRFRAAGVNATLIASLGQSRQAIVRDVVAFLHRPRPVTAADLRTVAQVLGGREPLVRVDNSAWFQLELRAPP